MATATLVCKQCNFENEPERVYCHNCGAKLDRSLLPPEAVRREDPVVMQERVRKMVSPRRGLGLQGVKNFVGSLVIAAALAAMILIIKPPANLPVISQEMALNAPAVTSDLEGLTEQPSRALKYTEDSVNAFLQYSLRGKKDAAATTLTFDRVFLHFREGTCSITMQQSLFGLPLYITTVRTVQVQGGKLVSSPLSGSVGSLRLPGPLLPFQEKMFAQVWQKMDHAHQLLAKLQAITFHDKTVEMTSKPAAAAR